jgi:large-conductance mechanosensitive channel
MTPARDEAKQNLLNGLRALVVTGNLHDWVSVMMLFAIPISFGLALSEMLRSLLLHLITPLLLTPILSALQLSSLSDWVIPLGRDGGYVRIGQLIGDGLIFGLTGLLLFGLTRLLRKWC